MYYQKIIVDLWNKKNWKKLENLCKALHSKVQVPKRCYHLLWVYFNYNLFSYCKVETIDIIHAFYHMVGNVGRKVKASNSKLSELLLAQH